jgi:hypothetical protein
MNRFSASLLGAVAMAATAVGTSDPAAAAGTRFECRDQLAREDASMTAKFERIGARRKFSVEFEAARGGSFRAGDVLRVRVDGVLVGRLRLVRGPRDIVGDLNFDTRPQANARPFPPNFPRNVGAGTEVTLGVRLGCELQRR